MSSAVGCPIAWRIVGAMSKRLRRPRGAPPAGCRALEEQDAVGGSMAGL